MTRQIIALQRDAYEYMRDYIPRAIKSESIDEEHQVIDVELSENVIVKVYDNEMNIDLGAKRMTLEAEDFYSFCIR